MAVSSQTNLFTTSVSWGGTENLNYFLKAQHTGIDPLNTPGIKLYPNVQSSLKINLFDAVSKKTLAYATGFSGGTGATYTQKTLTVADMKAEAANSAHEFASTVFETARKKGYMANDITDTILEEIIMEVWMRGVKQDLFRQIWLGDTAKTTVSSGAWTGTADVNYSAYNGFWKILMTDAATTAVSSTGTHIYRKAMAHAAVAQVDTVTLTTGSSGSLVIDVNGIAYSVAYGTSVAVTATLFFTTHAATILSKHHIVVTNPSSAALVFTANVAGVAHTIAVGSGSGITASGGVVATTANTAPTAMADDEAITYLEDLYVNSYPELVAAPASEKIFYVDMKVYHNYIETLEDGGTYTNMAKDFLINGIPNLQYRGVSILPMDWNSHIAGDFATNYYDEGRIIYTLRDNLAIGLDAESDFAQTEFWYEKLYEQNFFRTRYRAGVQYHDNKLTSVSY